MERAELEDEQKTLKGIAALLLSLSVLAGFLCVLPPSVRALVLSILRPAEAAARAFAVEQTGGALALPPIPDTDGDSRADALHLARCFRVLACFFCGLHGSAGRRLFRGGPNGRLAPLAPAIARRCHAMKPRRAMPFPAAACIDTS